MAEIEPHETDFIGQWTLSDRGNVADPTEERITKLVSGYLEEIATDESGWETLYKVPQDGRFWELTCPHGEYHRGGPRRLTNLSIEQARSKYGNQINDRRAATP